MQTRNVKDILGGLTLVILGLWATWHCYEHYRLGTFRNMGPGMFPMGISMLLSVFGVFIAIPAFFRRGDRFRIDFHGAIFVLASVASFAVVVPNFGLVPAIIATVVISSFAAPSFRPISVAVLTAFLCVISWLIFSVGLGMTIPMFKSPF